jgi:3-oxoadipate enol-lactonase
MTPTDRQDDLSRGLRNRRHVLGDAWVDRSLDGANAFNADFQALISEYAWHAIWGRPALDHETRRLLVLGMTMAAARWEEFELHCKAAIEHGVPLERIRETLMQGAIYCGVPAANTAFKLTLGVLRELGRAPEPSPLSDAVRATVQDTFSAPPLRVALRGQSGDRLPVVLAHALGLDHRMWDDLAVRLAGDGHPVLAWDARGHGASSTPPGPWTMDDLVADAARLVREWGVGPVAFVGLSMGGMVGQGLAIRHPELVARLVLANTTSAYPPEAVAMWQARIAAVEQGGVASIAEAAVERFFTAATRATRPELVTAARGSLHATGDAGYANACRAIAGVDWRSGLGSVRAPTLVIAGGEDVGTPPALAQAIARAIPGARLETIADAAHLSAVERPERFHALVAAFLAAAPESAP